MISEIETKDSHNILTVMPISAEMEQKELLREVLRSFSILQESEAHSKNFWEVLRRHLFVTECFMRESLLSEAKNQIEKVMDLVVSPPHHSIDDIRRHADIYSYHSSTAQAIVLRYCLSKLYLTDLRPNDALRGLSNDCSYKISLEIRDMYRIPMCAAAKEIGISFLLEMLDDLRDTKDVESDEKTKYEAYCLNNVGYGYFGVNDPENALKMYKEALKLMKKQFGREAAQYQIYGILLHNIGITNVHCGSREKAKKFLFRALDAKEKSADCSSGRLRHESLKQTRNILKKLGNK